MEKSIVGKIFELLTHPRLLFGSIIYHTPKLWSDEFVIRYNFKSRMGYTLNLNNPQTFSEKLQWLKLHDRRPEFTTMVDKFSVKEYVASKLGEEYIIPTLGVWDRVEDIEWDKLPNQFVLKCTHDSGGLIICKDKSKLDKSAAEKKLRKCLRSNYWYHNREWPYKNVPRRILAEKYVEPSPNVKDLPDYKWYCFDGEPKFCQVIQDRSTKETIDFFDTEWHHQEFVGLNPDAGPAMEQPKRPANLDVQIRIARELSKGMPFSRIDLYETGRNTYFGEITFYPASGMGSFRPDRYNELLGQMLVLPGMKRGGNN